MSDLISRSRVIENIWDVFNAYANDSLRFDEYETEAINNACKVLQKVIEGQPIAYDEEKVVEELEEAKEKIATEDYCRTKHYVKNDCEHKDCFKCCAEYLIDIVRKGGVECIK